MALRAVGVAVTAIAPRAVRRVVWAPSRATFSTSMAQAVAGGRWPFAGRRDAAICFLHTLTFSESELDQQSTPTGQAVADEPPKIVNWGDKKGAVTSLPPCSSARALRRSPPPTSRSMSMPARACPTSRRPGRRTGPPRLRTRAKLLHCPSIGKLLTNARPATVARLIRPEIQMWSCLLQVTPRNQPARPETSSKQFHPAPTSLHSTIQQSTNKRRRCSLFEGC